MKTSFRSRVKARLEKYLELDKSGIRKYLLKAALSLRKFTIDKIHELLSQRFKVTRHVIASMVGYIYSNLGILRLHKKDYKSPTEYSLKVEYHDLVEAVITS